MNCEDQTNFFRKGIQKPAEIDPKAFPRASKIGPGTLPGRPGSPKELPGTCWSVPGTPWGCPDSAPGVPGTSLSARNIAPKHPETLRSDQTCHRVASKCRKIDVFRAARSRSVLGTCFFEFQAFSRSVQTLQSTAPVDQNRCSALLTMDRREWSAGRGIPSKFVSFSIQNGVQRTQFRPEWRPSHGISCELESAIFGNESAVLGKEFTGVGSP